MLFILKGKRTGNEDYQTTNSTNTILQDNLIKKKKSLLVMCVKCTIWLTYAEGRVYQLAIVEKKDLESKSEGSWASFDIPSVGILLSS